MHVIFLILSSILLGSIWSNSIEARSVRKKKQSARDENKVEEVNNLNHFFDVKAQDQPKELHFNRTTLKAKNVRKGLILPHAQSIFIYACSVDDFKIFSNLRAPILKTITFARSGINSLDGLEHIQAPVESFQCSRSTISSQRVLEKEVLPSLIDLSFWYVTYQGNLKNI